MKTTMVLSIVLCICSAIFVPEINAKDGDDCCPLTGTWINQHGSFLELNHSADGTLTGKFFSTVGASKGASGEIQQVYGRAGKGKPTTFGFVVSFKDGKTTTAWSGQYHFCDKEQTLITTWVMTSLTASCDEERKGNRVGQDRFVRKAQRKTGSKWGNYVRKLFNKIYRTKIAKNTGIKF